MILSDVLPALRAHTACVVGEARILGAVLLSPLLSNAEADEAQAMLAEMAGEEPPTMEERHGPKLMAELEELEQRQREWLRTQAKTR